MILEGSVACSVVYDAIRIIRSSARGITTGSNLAECDGTKARPFAARVAVPSRRLVTF
jgi:hypothetical protein